jgi:hypothetical protein
MKLRLSTTKKVFNKKTLAVQKADTIDFIRKAINDSRSTIKDIMQEKNAASESTSIPQKTKSGLSAVYIR